MQSNTGLLKVLRSKGLKVKAITVHDSFVKFQYKGSTEIVLRWCMGKQVSISSLVQRYLNESIPLHGNVLWYFNREGYLEGFQF